MEVKGQNGTVVVQDHSVIIRRSGLNVKLLGLRGDKEIMIKDIVAVQFKKPGMLTNGFIQFTFAGGNERKGGTFNASTDENSVVFTKSKLRAFESVRDFINKKRNDILNNSNQGSFVNQDDVYNQIEKLADLRNKGLITTEEFDAKKKQLLGI
ncbi:MAG: DUF4429 domain-containing protein [Psychroflexus sp.]